jgi:aminoglycoside phosphotransferase (APT) family kinase protein
MYQPVIDASLARRLVAAQFPKWAGLPIRPVVLGGWDNRTFHLGEQMLVRLPSAEVYASQVEREQRWLPKLAPMLPVQIPEPLAMGEPFRGYPWRWSIYRWIEGQTIHHLPADCFAALASELATFLSALHAIESTDGPEAGPESFYRDGSLQVYDHETRRAAEVLDGRMDVGLAMRVWDRALQSSWKRPPVWVHGDLSEGNLLMRDGRLSGVIDFGQLSVGDPACDLVLSWTLFDGNSRDAFRAVLSLDPDTWVRGRAWALWKAMIIAAGISEANAAERARCWPTITEVLLDHARTEA